MTITLDGTLGITSPAETVQGALTTTGNTILGDATTDTLTVGVTGIVKDASGNVGIGTASPSSYGKFVVVNNGVSGLVVSNGATTDFHVDTTGTVTTLRNTAVASLAFNTNGAVCANITPAGLFQFNSGYGSAATAYGCRAWVNFNGTGTVAIRASGNVSSITDNGIGDYTVNFTTAMVDINYSIVGSTSPTYAANNSAFNINSSGTAASIGEIAPTVSACRIITTSPGPAALDAKYINISIFR
jgi:hypothetical protein